MQSRTRGGAVIEPGTLLIQTNFPRLLNTASLSNIRHNFLVDLPLKYGSGTLIRFIIPVYLTGIEPPGI